MKNEILYKRSQEHSDTTLLASLYVSQYGII